MRFQFLSIFIITICSSCTLTVKPTENEQRLIDSIHKVLEVKTQLADNYWPEFGKGENSAPVIFYADSASYVLNPKQRFLDEFNCTKLNVKGSYS